MMLLGLSSKQALSRRFMGEFLSAYFTPIMTCAIASDSFFLEAFRATIEKPSSIIIFSYIPCLSNLFKI
jgi:hypothetical protein